MQNYNLFISFLKHKLVSLTPSKVCSLNANDVIIYSIYLPTFNELISDLSKFLNSTELNRAERFHKEKDRNRFIICRSILKFVIAKYTNLEVENISLDYHSTKKPYLASHPSFCFNVSHSEDYAVIVISRNEVGIDIEHISEDFDFTNLLSTIFNDNEILAIQNAENKRHAFYTSWTRKEAFVKALGKGIDDSFKNIPCLDGQHILDSSLMDTTASWQVDRFEIAENYIGAVAYIKQDGPKNIEMTPIPNTMDGLLKLIKHLE